MNAPRFWEKALAVSGLFLSTAAVFPLLRSGGEAAALPYDENGDPLVRGLWLAIYAVVVVVLLLRFGEAMRVLSRQKLVLTLVALAAVSVVWSEASGLTLQRSAALALTTAFAVYVATRFRPSSLIDLVAGALGIVAVVSLALIALEPSLGLDHARGDAWRGAFTTKNELGRMMTLAALVWLTRLVVRRGRVSLSLGFLVLSLVLVAGSGSRGSLVALGILTVVVLAVQLARAHETVALPGVAFLLLACGFAATWMLGNTQTILRFLGAEDTLTGRTRIWSVARDMTRENLWLGYGYDAFWRGLDGPSAQVWVAVQSAPPHAHNGFLDLWLELGLVGLALFALSFLGNVRTAVAHLRGERRLGTVFCALFLGYLFVFNLSESSLLTRNSIFWILYVAVSVQLADARAEAAVERRERVAGFALPVGARP
jgi:O-antigen ligase